MVASFNRSSSNHFSRRGGASFGSPRFGAAHRSTTTTTPTTTTTNPCLSHSFHILIATCLVISFLLAIGCGYIYVLPTLTQAIHSYAFPIYVPSVSTCDVFQGAWVSDTTYPLYNASNCPFVEQGFNCLGNGRTDDGYLKWRWKPNECDIPKFNVLAVLEMLRGKRVVLVGDSMSRTQWESLICLLMSGVKDKKSVYEVNGNKITKQIRFLGVRFETFNFTVEFFRSVFLVQRGWIPRNGPKRVRSTLRLDRLDDISKKWIDADVLIFNTGQWWTPGKLFETQGLLFPDWWIVEAWNANYHCLQDSTSHLGILGSDHG